eukprot:scaffold31_cov312-Prasinococcus_capsulatus_cf.AAC.5
MVVPVQLLQPDEVHRPQSSGGRVAQQRHRQPCTRACVGKWASIGPHLRRRCARLQPTANTTKKTTTLTTAGACGTMYRRRRGAGRGWR